VPYSDSIRRSSRQRSTNKIKVENWSESTDPEAVLILPNHRDTSRQLVGKKEEELRPIKPAILDSKRAREGEGGNSGLDLVSQRAPTKDELHSPELVRRTRKRLVKTELDDAASQPVFQNRKRLMESNPGEDFAFKIDSDDDEEIIVVKQLLNKPRSLRSRSTRNDAEHIFLL